MTPDTKSAAKGEVTKARPKKKAPAKAAPNTKSAAPLPKTEAPTPAAMAEDERRLARGAAILIPVATVLTSLVVGVITSPGPALLVLAGGIILGTIALFWASLRTLTGDAPLASDLEQFTFSAPADPLALRKTMLLRALKDLDGEKAIGKIHAADYASLSQRYREEIKDIMRNMDASIAPHVKDAEAAFQKHLVRVGLAGDPFRTSGKAAQAKEEALAKDDAPESGEAATVASARPTCPACSTSNDPDARFCKSCGATLPVVTQSPKDLDAVFDAAAHLVDAEAQKKRVDAIDASAADDSDSDGDDDAQDEADGAAKADPKAERDAASKRETKPESASPVIESTDTGDDEDEHAEKSRVDHA